MKKTNKRVLTILLLIVLVTGSFISGMYVKEYLYKKEEEKIEQKEDKKEETDNTVQYDETGFYVITDPPELKAEDVLGGAAGVKALPGLKFTQEAMLKWALEDELLARDKYITIMNKFGEIKPFSNIKKAEYTHIDLLLSLFKKYNIEQVEVYETSPFTGTLKEAFEVSIEAETANIEMYDRFLNQEQEEELNDDVRDAFEKLKSASEKHLEAFKNGLNRIK